MDMECEPTSQPGSPPPEADAAARGATAVKNGHEIEVVASILQRKKEQPTAMPSSPAPRVVLVQFYVRNMSMSSLKDETVLSDTYLAFTWRQHTTDAALLQKAQRGCAGGLAPGDPAYAEALAAIPQGELMNARDCELKLGEPAALMVFEAASKWGLAETYGAAAAGSIIPADELAPLRAVYHLKGTFSLEDVVTAASDFPFDVHYPSIVFESWEESSDLVFVPSPSDNVLSMLDATSDIPLFPLSEWDLVSGPSAIGMQDGVRLWTFTRHYKSDIFTTDGSGVRTGASFSNVILTIAVGRQPSYFLTQVVPMVVVMDVMSVLMLCMPLYPATALTIDDVRGENLSNRLGTLSTLLLAAVAYKLAIADVMSATPKMTYLDYLFSAFYMANTIAVVLSVVAYLSPTRAQVLDTIAIVVYCMLCSGSLLYFLKGYLCRRRSIRQRAEGLSSLMDGFNFHGRKKRQRQHRLRV